MAGRLTAIPDALSTVSVCPAVSNWESPHNLSGSCEWSTANGCAGEP